MQRKYEIHIAPNPLYHQPMTHPIDQKVSEAGAELPSYPVGDPGAGCVGEGPTFSKIIHIDMDAFYASVEQRDDPKLQNRPVIVGGPPESRGVVCSASYEARRYGVRSAMSSSQAKKLCPEAAFIFPHFDKYIEASRAIRTIFHEVTDLVEPLSLDEAYLDVTTNHFNEPLAQKLAKYIKDKIHSTLHLTASAGVGPNKFIAKLASDFRKPNGLVVVAPEKVSQFIETLPVERFWGVGPATAKKLQARGMYNAEDIRKRTVEELERTVGSYGRFLFGLAHGEDSREVDPSIDPKTRGTETTFKRDILDTTPLLDQLRVQAEEIASTLKDMGVPCRTVSLKLKYSDFTSITRSHTLFFPTDEASAIYKVVSELLFKNTAVGEKPVRLIGISVSQFVTNEEPLQLCFQFEGFPYD